MKAIKILQEYEKFVAYYPEYAEKVKEALIELQGLERYIAKQVEALQAKISTRTDSGGDKEKKEAYIDILQRIRGENDNR